MKKNLLDVRFGGDADYDNIQTTTIDSNSSIDVTVGQNNFGKKIPMYYGRSRKRKTRKRRRQQAEIGWTHLVGGQYYDGFSGSVLLVLSRGSLLPIAHSKDPSYLYMNKREYSTMADFFYETLQK